MIGQSMVVRSNGVDLTTRVDGSAGRPWIVLSNSLASSFGCWDAQIETLARTHRVLRYDTRGHGRSACPPGPYSFDDLVADLVGLLDHYAIARADGLGLSLGGMTMLGLAVAHRERLVRLVCCDARADAVPPFVASWDARIAAVRSDGMEAVVETTLNRWFTPAFRAGEPGAVADAAAMIRATDPRGYIGCAEALKRLDFKRRLGAIAVPALFVCGAQDQASPPAEMRAMAELTPHGRFAEIDPGAHVCNIENPARFNAVLGEWLAAAGSDGTIRPPDPVHHQ